MSGKNTKKKNSGIEWTTDCEVAFHKLKELCSSTPVLAYPDYKQKFKLYTDSSESGLGAVLTQIKDDNMRDQSLMLVGPSPSQNKIMMLISWNFWLLSGQLPIDFMSTFMAVLLTFIPTITH